MANYVRISTLSASPASADPDTDTERILDGMIAHWRSRLDQVLPDRPDLIVLPEACDRPYETPVDKLQAYYRVRGDRMRDFFAAIAREHHCYIAYSAVREIARDRTWRNSTQVIDRSGRVAGIYNKNHVVCTEYEDAGILYGKDAPIIQCDFGRVACAICFDLNFDELRLKYVEAKPDLLIFSSMYHGGLMQAYWAYSCRSHFVAAVHNLPSAIISPVGKILAATTNYRDFVTATVNLDCVIAHLDDNAEGFKALKEKYGPKVTVDTPPFLGPMLISSETEECSAREMAAAFEIELIDDYFARSLAHRHAPGHIEP